MLGHPNIRFYAGAPLVTKKNHVLGTLCIIDSKPRPFSKDQKEALKILAKKAMAIIEVNKTMNSLHTSIQLTTERLTKITQNIPLGIFELEVSEAGDVNFLFLSEGIKQLHPGVNIAEWLKDSSIGFSLMHPDDIEPLRNALALSIKNKERLYYEYRVKVDGGYDWHAIAGKPMEESLSHSAMFTPGCNCLIPSLRNKKFTSPASETSNSNMPTGIF